MVVALAHLHDRGVDYWLWWRSGLTECPRIGPHLSNERTVENRANEHFHASFDIYQFGRERKHNQISCQV